MEGNKKILLVAQRSPDVDEPGAGDLYSIGTIASVLQLLKLPDGTIKVLVEGTNRAEIISFGERNGLMVAHLRELEPAYTRSEREIGVIGRSLTTLFEQLVKLSRKLPPELMSTLSGIDDPSRLADTIASHISVRVADKQRVLETADVADRMELLVSMVDGEIDVQQIEKRIRGRVKSQMEKSQREYYLNEQMKAIQKELGDMDEAPNELDELGKKIAAAGMPKPIETKARTELNKLKQMSPMSAEATVVRNYIDSLLGVPWKKKTKVRRDLRIAQQVLDDDHFGLEKVKERILEYLGRAAAREQDEGTDPVPRRSARRRQDLARPVDRQGDQPQVHPHVARRRARRSRDPRPSPHVHRFDAGPHHPEPDQGRHQESAVRARRNRQDVDGFPRRSVGGAARSARSRAEPHVQRSLPRGRRRSLRSDVDRDRELAEHSAGAGRPHGSHPHSGLHRGGEDQHRAALSRAQAAQGERSQGRRAADRRARDPRHHPLLHARIGRAQSRARDLQDLPQGRQGAQPRRGEGREERRRIAQARQGQRERAQSRQLSRRAQVHLRPRGAAERGRSRHRVSPGPKSAAICSASKRRSCRARAS